MKALINIKKNGAIIAVLFLLTAGCSFMKANLIKEGSLNLETIPSTVKISSVRAYVESDLIKVVGEVSRQNCNAKDINGHVDIALLSPDKKILYKTSINYEEKKSFLPVHATHHHSKHFNRDFKTAIPLVPPQGSSIKIAFHNVPFDGAVQTDCGQNMTVN